MPAANLSDSCPDVSTAILFHVIANTLVQPLSRGKESAISSFDTL
jgi:hypothetical protein